MRSCEETSVSSVVSVDAKQREVDQIMNIAQTISHKSQEVTKMVLDEVIKRSLDGNKVFLMFVQMISSGCH